MYKIKLANETYNGVVSNIRFVDGVATVDNLSEDDKRWFERYKAIVEKVEEIEEVEKVKEEKPKKK